MTQVAVVTFLFGIIGILLVIGVQAFNVRSSPVWTYPNWRANPFTMKEPLQFFHLCGYFFLVSGVGGLLHVVLDPSLPASEPAIFASTGAGVICGVWVSSRLFRRKMART